MRFPRAGESISGLEKDDNMMLIETEPAIKGNQSELLPIQFENTVL